VRGRHFLFKDDAETCGKEVESEGANGTSIDYATFMEYFPREFVLRYGVGFNEGSIPTLSSELT